jgi:sulfotransferase
MESKTQHFLAGLPRSGSTLLANLLLQNPRFHATGTSPLLETLINARNHMDKLPDYRAMPEELRKTRKVNVLKGILNNYYADVERPVVFDKCRGWPFYIETAEMVLNRKVKILATVRDLRDVLSSLERLWRRNKSMMSITQEEANVFNFQTVAQRANFWVQNNQLVGLAINQIRDAFARGFKSRIHLIEFEDLTNKPAKVMADIYDFLDEPKYEHNFESIEPIVKEDDYEYNFPGLHDIRTKVEPVKSMWKEILGDEVGMVYARDARFWRDLT